MDDPLREAVETSLKSTFLSTYKFDIPPTWLGVPSLIGRLHRELQKRSHIATKVEQVRTMGQLHEGRSALKKQRLSPLLELTIGQAEHQVTLSMPLQYLLALQALMYSMCYAGTYTISVGGAEPGPREPTTLQVPLQHCLAHLADAQKFVAGHVGKASEHSILVGLRKIDEIIRQKWAEAFRTSALSFGAVMQATEPFAATLWMAPGAVGGQQQQQSPNSPGNGNKLSKGPGKLGNGGGKSPRGGSGEFAAKLDNKNGGGGKGAKQPGPQIKSVRADKDGKLFCKHWNDNRNGTGCHFGATCTAKHACDALMPDGSACNATNHKRANHRNGIPSSG